MRRTFKKIGIGLLTTALVVTGIPTGKVSAMAETEPVVHEALDSEQEDPSGGGEAEGNGKIEDSEAGADIADESGAGEHESDGGGTDGNENEADESGTDGGEADETEAGERGDGSEETGAGENGSDETGAGEGGSESDKTGAGESGSESDKTGAGESGNDETGTGTDSGINSGSTGAGEAEDSGETGTGKIDTDEVDTDETDTDDAGTDGTEVADEEDGTEAAAELSEADGELAAAGIGADLSVLDGPEMNDEGAYVYEAEEYYEREEGIQTDGDVIFCDMQPGESIIIPVHESMEGGTYQMVVRSNGNRTEFKVYVNDEYVGRITRDGSGWDAVDLTEDSLEELLILAPGDEVKLSAPDDFGKVDAVLFIPVEEPIPDEDGVYVYEAEDYYEREEGILTDGDVIFCDMQPGETITITADDFLEKGKYQLTVRSNGNRTEFKVYVNDEYAGSITRDGSGWDAVDLTEDDLEELITVKPGDKITISAPNDFGKVDALILTLVEKTEDPAESEDGIYEAEDYYERKEGIQTDGDVTFCDMQPGESIVIPVGDSLEKGNYQLTIRSNGNRTKYDIYVNNKYAGSITRDGSGWDAVDLTDDSLDGLLMLNPGDEIKISAPDDFGKVDFVILTAVEGQPFEEQDAASGIIVSAKPDVVPAESVLLVEAPEEAELEAICQENGIDRAKGTFFNLRLIDGAGSAVELAGDEVTVKIPLPDGYQANAIRFVRIAEDGSVTELDGTLQNGQIVLQTDSFGIFGILDTKVIAAGSYIFEAENYYSGDIQGDNGVTYCDMQPGEMIAIPVDDQKMPEGNYRLSVSSNGTRTGFAIYINGIPAGTVKRTATGWNAADLTEDEYDGVFHLQPGDEIQIKAPVNKWEDDGSLYGKLDSITLTAVDEEPEAPGLLEQVVLQSEDWYFGKPDDAGGVNLRPQDQIDYFIRTEDGFGEEESKYQLTVCAGGFRTQYTILVNGEEIGSLARPNTEWGELNDTMFGQMVTLKAGDILTIYAEESWGTVADIILDKIKVQDPYKAVDAASGIVIAAEPGVVPEGSILTVEAPDEAELEKICASYSIDRSKGTFHKILLTDGQGSPVQTLGAVTVEIPVPEGYAESSITACRITDDGDLELLDIAVENGMVCMETKELGLIAVLDSVGSIRTLQAEDYYENASGIQTDGNVKFCDVQPGEAVNFQIPEDMAEGYYALTVSSNGTRTAYTVSVNGKMQGVIKRGESGWGAADLTKDGYQGVLKLKTGDILTLTASVNLNEGDSPTYGKLDAITLVSAPEPEAYEELDEITLSAADWYGGTQDISGGMNIRPGDGIDFAVREQDGFTEGDYVISVRTCGFRKSYTVKVNGQSVMELPVRNSEWGVYLTGTSLVTVHLVPGDVITFYEADSWGCIDTVTFYKGDVPAGDSMTDRTGGRIKVVNYDESAGAKASGTEPVFIYQGEGYYQKQSDNPAADLQPGEQIEIVLADNENFVDGLYQVTVVSCGTRDHMFVKVNGKKTGRIDRKPGGYGMDKMTRDRLAGTVSLHKGDLLCIEAAPSEWGWVDYIRLDLVQKSEEESQGRRYEYQAMNYYGKKQAEWDVADLQPGEKIEIPVDRDDFEDGYYYVSVTSCGGRKKMEVEVNGQQAGWIQRNSNNYGIRSLTRDTMPVPVYIRRGDKVAVCAPSDGGWAWVDRIDLIKAGK